MLTIESSSSKAVGLRTGVTQRAYYPALDGLRAIAFFLVFFFHYGSIPWGFAGVEIFFVLSGFLITGILYDARDDDNRFSRFYFRRSIRILPLYYGSLLLLAVAALFTHATLDWRWLAWVFHLGNWLLLDPSVRGGAGPTAFGVLPFSSHPDLYLSVSHFWSLCVEEQFYLVWPTVIFFVKDRRRLMQVSVALIVLCPLARMLFHHANLGGAMTNAWLYRLTPFRLDAFMYGGLLALLRRGDFDLGRLKKIAEVGAALIASFYLLQSASQLKGILVRHRDFQYPAWHHTWGLLGLDLLSLCVLVLALDPGTMLYKLLQWRPLQLLGKVSYGAYVFHYIPIALYLKLTSVLPVPHKIVLTTLIAAVVTLVLSILSYRYFEQPFNWFKDHTLSLRPGWKGAVFTPRRAAAKNVEALQS